MFDRATMTISFPHIIPTNKLGNRDWNWNDVDGGIKKLADFGIARNSFFGGQVTILGLIKSLGIWACQHYETKRIVGFYVDTGDRVTDAGRELLAVRFSDCKIAYVNEPPKATSISAEDRAKKDALREELKSHGIAPEMITHTTAKELENLLNAVKSGKVDKPIVEVEAPQPSVYAENPKTINVPSRTKRERVV